MAGRSRDPAYAALVQEGILCKLWSCTPSTLRKENWDDVVIYSIVYNQIAKKNPMALFM